MRLSYLYVTVGLCLIASTSVGAATPEIHQTGILEFFSYREKSALIAAYHSMFEFIMIFSFLPPAIAYGRGHKDTVWILFLSLFIGWTLISSIVLLYYAALSNTRGPIGRKDIEHLAAEIKELRKEVKFNISEENLFHLIEICNTYKVSREDGLRRAISLLENQLEEERMGEIEKTRGW